MANRAGFGNTRKLPSGRWQARYPDEAGLPTKAPDTFITKADAQAHLAMVRADLGHTVFTHQQGELLGIFLTDIDGVLKKK